MGHDCNHCPPTGLNVSNLYTDPVAVGRKGQDHDVVEQRFWDEMKALSYTNIMYSGSLKQNVPVVVKEFAHCVDRP